MFALSMNNFKDTKVREIHVSKLIHMQQNKTQIDFMAESLCNL